MQIGRVENATRVLGKSQGYIGIPVRDEAVDGVPCMVTSWHPTPRELAALNAGAPVHVKILGTDHPPILVEVGQIPG
jgi:hypothetical protein